jgi:hypothetical protein
LPIYENASIETLSNFKSVGVNPFLKFKIPLYASNS